jgi:hypothetical protein
MRSKIHLVRPPRLTAYKSALIVLIHLEMENLPDVINDLDVDFTLDPAAAATYLNDQRNIRKIREATQNLQVNIINPPRPGKRLLVLDIDYSKHETCSST